MLKYSKKLTLKCLHNICKINKIKYISILNKNDIINLLNKTSAAKIIQKRVRYNLNFNIECPISHSVIKYPWICIKNNKKFIYYDFNTFVMYLSNIKELRDPCTRIPITDKKIFEINNLITYYNGKFTNKIIISDSMIKNIDLNITVYCLYDLINEVDIKYTNLEEMYAIYLPRFIYYIQHLISNQSNEISKTVLKACKETVKNVFIHDYISIMENVI